MVRFRRTLAWFMTKQIPLCGNGIHVWMVGRFIFSLVASSLLQSLACGVFFASLFFTLTLFDFDSQLLER